LLYLRIIKVKRWDKMPALFHKRKNFLLFSIIVIIAYQDVFPQNELNFRQFGRETEKFINQPGKWESGDWGMIGLAAASSFLLMQFDESIRDEVILNRAGETNFAVEFGRIWGEPYNTALISGINTLSGIVNDDYLNRKVAFEIIQSALYTGLITQLMKITFGRSRPYNDNGAFSFAPLTLFSDDDWSFPSGHTSLGFSLSTILSENTSNGTLKILYYVPAILTAYSRVYEDKHWVSDVFIGALIGYSVGKWVSKIHKQNEGTAQPVQSFYISIPL